MCPDQELNQQPFGAQDNAAQTTEPHQPGLTFSLLNQQNSQTGVLRMPVEKEGQNYIDVKDFWDFPQSHLSACFLEEFSAGALSYYGSSFWGIFFLTDILLWVNLVAYSCTGTRPRCPLTFMKASMEGFWSPLVKRKKCFCVWAVCRQKIVRNNAESHSKTAASQTKRGLHLWLWSQLTWVLVFVTLSTHLSMSLSFTYLLFKYQHFLSTYYVPTTIINHF